MNNYKLVKSKARYVDQNSKIRVRNTLQYDQQSQIRSILANITRIENILKSKDHKSNFHP